MSKTKRPHMLNIDELYKTISEQAQIIDRLKSTYDEMYAVMVKENLATMNDLEGCLKQNSELKAAQRGVEELIVQYDARCDQIELIADVVSEDLLFSNALLAVERIQKIIEED